MPGRWPQPLNRGFGGCPVPQWICFPVDRVPAAGYGPPPGCRVGRSLNHWFKVGAAGASLGFSAEAEPAHRYHSAAPSVSVLGQRTSSNHKHGRGHYPDSRIGITAREFEKGNKPYLSIGRLYTGWQLVVDMILRQFFAAIQAADPAFRSLCQFINQRLMLALGFQTIFGYVQCGGYHHGNLVRV